MFKNHFGITHVPFSKNCDLCPSETLADFKKKFTNLLSMSGIGVLTGEPGVGKTAAIHHVVHSINPHQYKVVYLSETHFTTYDIYRQIATSLGIMPSNRCAQLWREIKDFIKDSVDNKRCQIIFIIDEAHNLPYDFLKGFPSFLNYDFDSRDLLTIWFVGHPQLLSILNRNIYIALNSRIRYKCAFEPVIAKDNFKQLVESAFKTAGCNSTLLSDSGVEILHVASQGIFRNICRILTNSLQLAAEKNLSYLPDSILEEVIKNLRG